MAKNFVRYFKKLPYFLACISIIIAATVMLAGRKSKPDTETSSMQVLDLWQIDGFEGGKGSRSAYLQALGNEFTSGKNYYITVKSLTADAARKNIESGALPDMISYGAGMWGIENLITGKRAYYCWAHGGYCFLTVNDAADFSDISAQNTILNEGTDNLAGVAALFCNVAGCRKDKPTGAYVKLLSGEYKYLLGTQRDIFRLKTRGVQFKVLPVSQFNDLYQNISITASDAEKIEKCTGFIDFLLAKSDKLTQLGLMQGAKLYSDEMSVMEGINYEYKLLSPVSKETYDKIISAEINSDINLLKNLFK